LKGIIIYVMVTVYHPVVNHWLKVNKDGLAS